MNIKVLSDDWEPQKLVNREGKVDEVREALSKSNIVIIEGVSGVGKTTLTRRITKTIINCLVSRSYPAILKALKSVAKTNIVAFDDFTLAITWKNINLVRRISAERKVILIVHPWVSLPISGVKVVMPPYNSKEIYDIIVDRVRLGNLDADDDALLYIAEKVGYPRGSGSARVAITLVRSAIQVFGRLNMQSAEYVIRKLYRL